MSSNSIDELPANLQTLHLDSKKKKRSHRAFHDTAYSTPLQSQSSSFTHLSSQYSDNNGHDIHSTAVQNGVPAFQAPEPNSTTSSTQVSSMPVTVNISNPLEMKHTQLPELSIALARYAEQNEFCTPLVDEEGNSLGYKSFLSFQNIVPPVAGTQYHSIDQGTATPKHIRATMYNVPESEPLRKATRLPMAVTIRPFAPLLPTEDPVPTVDMSTLGKADSSDPMDMGPPRCNRCRTYMNPSMMHDNLGKFTCNICQFPNNSVTPEYFCSVDPLTNQRLDRALRPELHKGVYDIIVPKYYNVGGADVNPQCLHHVFLIDISHQSLAKQLPIIVTDAIRAAISIPEAEDFDSARSRQKIAIILFDTRMHFFNLSPNQRTAQVWLSGDLDDPFVPFSNGLFADPNESEIIIEDALNKIEMLCSDNSLHDSEPCLSVALRTAGLCLEQVGGGKITSVLSTLSSWGPGRSKMKENRSVGRAQGADAERELFSPDNEYYKLLAKDFVSQNVGLDVYAVSDASIDVSNIGWLASLTGGTIIKYTKFLFERDARTLTSQIVDSMTKATGYQGQLKLRCSNGLQVAQYYGFPTGSDRGIVGYANAVSSDPVIPVLNEDQSFTILLEYDGTLNTKYDCHFQAALLYTDITGVRKVRVINLVLAVSERLSDVFNFVDQDAVVTTIVRDTVSFIGKESIVELRRSLNEKLVDVFTAYRRMSERNHNRNSILANQLIFPDSLKHLPNYFLSLIKSKALRDSTTIDPDTRLCDIFQMLHMPIEKLVFHLWPALVELHSLEPDEGLPFEDAENVDGFIKLPLFKDLNASVLENGVYILCNGTTVYIRIHPDSNQLLLKDLFGDNVETISDIDPKLDALPELPTHISLQARNLVKYFRQNIIGTNKISSSAVVIFREEIDSSSTDFAELLIEDKFSSRSLNTAPSYAQFLTSLHRAVKVKIDSESKTSRNDTVASNSETLAQRMIHF